MPLLFLQGQAALSDFRLDSLKAALTKTSPGGSFTRFAVTFVYALETEVAPGAESLARAATLLDASATPGITNAANFFVAPRKGTISPWSSKATDIFAHCGLANITRVERAVAFDIAPALTREQLGVLHDRMTEGVYTREEMANLFEHLPPARGRTFDVPRLGRAAIVEANETMGLALSDEEIDYLVAAYTQANRAPTDTELLMFGQVNSEHCRHKIFNARWIIDGREQDMTLFGMIKHTHATQPAGTLGAYKDNSSVLEGGGAARVLAANPSSHVYGFEEVTQDMLIKVETHNHPTAISPAPGAATGVGGEIRDESATGTGSRSKAGLCGFVVSHLRLPEWSMPWETPVAEPPRRLASPLSIMVDGPIGGAAFGNEFGRPQLNGFFRTCETRAGETNWGYHKPIMLAGGMGNIRREHVQKKDVPPRALIVQIGGPALRIGLGGGAASSMASGANQEHLDFDSVQRGNAEMQRRCQGVIDACAAMGAKNPILSIHDIGAGGLSNGCPELVEATGATFQLRAVHNQEPSMSPMEIWCCEAQERYVLAVQPESRVAFETLCERERCPVAFIGVTRDDERLVLEDSHFNDKPIDMDIRVLLGKPPKMTRRVTRVATPRKPLDLSGVTPRDALERVLRFPAVANKTFLISITDRTVTGLVHRDQMCGPYQQPVADHAVTAAGFHTFTGEAMCVGERTPVAILSPEASGRMAVGEALTNLASAPVGHIHNVKLSGNWMAACDEPGQDAALFDTVRAVAMELCPQIGLAIPVGKDSLSMRTAWVDSNGAAQRQVSPLSLIASAFSPVYDVRLDVTPDFKNEASQLLLIDLGNAKNRLGASSLAQVYGQVGDTPPDVDAPQQLAQFFAAMQELVAKNLLLAYHDRSDGGAIVTLLEMAFASGRGFRVDLPGNEPLAALFNEELGAVLQIRTADYAAVAEVLSCHGLRGITHEIGTVSNDKLCAVSVGGKEVFILSLSKLRRAWSELTWRMQTLRDNPVCAKQEYDASLDDDDPGLNFKLTYTPEASGISVKQKPRAAIFREQGVNGHMEMAAAFSAAGFEAVDLHMTDLLAGRVTLDTFSGIAACGGFSYGDVLGAGSGWARSILYNAKLVEQFATFFKRPDTFTLGVCNGCQMVSQLKPLIPGAAHWPAFKRNTCEQFEARLATVEILESPSVLFRGMAGSRIPIPVAHGEGRVVFDQPGDAQRARAAVRYVDNLGAPTEIYPLNPNGSAGGLTGFTSDDGRATILMPHPERGFRAAQLSYPGDVFKTDAGPWLRLFQNAFAFVN